MILNSIVPWGRKLSEYVSMFDLTKNTLENAKILGCGDGPASFNAELRALGGDVVSIDPTYAFTTEQIASRIDKVSQEVMAEVRKKQSDFVWKSIANPDTLYSMRMSAMKKFLSDYKVGKEEGRYKHEMLPSLSFSDRTFDLALSSHFLFLYSEHLDEIFHKEAIEEMLRVADEVRIFPLVTLSGEVSEHLAPIVDYLTSQGYNCEVVPTKYEFQKGADKMLKISYNKQNNI